MRSTRWIVLGGCTALLLSGGPVLADETVAAAGTQGAAGDREFLKQAIGVNELELQLGRLATERASTPELRAKAQKMVENHTKIEQQLRGLADQAGLAWNPELSPDQKKTLAQVESRSGTDFDAVFKQTVDAGHVDELAMYRGEVSRASSPELRALSEQRVAALEKAVSGAAQPAKGTGSGG